MLQNGFVAAKLGMCCAIIREIHNGGLAVRGEKEMCDASNASSQTVAMQHSVPRSMRNKGVYLCMFNDFGFSSTSHMSSHLQGFHQLVRSLSLSALGFGVHTYIQVSQLFSTKVHS